MGVTDRVPERSALEATHCTRGGKNAPLVLINHFVRPDKERIVVVVIIIIIIIIIITIYDVGVVGFFLEGLRGTPGTHQSTLSERPAKSVGADDAARRQIRAYFIASISSKLL